MGWLKGKEKAVGHVCPKPPVLFHSTVKLTNKCRWQCPDCFRIWTVEADWWGRSAGQYFKEHRLGPNDYWYYVSFDE